MYPTKSRVVNCGFGVRGPWAAGYHTGIDYDANIGTPVYATKGGRVIVAGMYDWYGSEYGYHIVISSQHNGRTVQHIYAHLSDFDVRVGAEVKAGQQIGNSGNSGRTTGPHLHYEERHAPFGYHDHHRPELIYYVPDTRPIIHLSRVQPGKKNEDILKLKKRLNKFFPNRRRLYGKRWTKALRKRYSGYQKYLGFSGTAANGIPGKISLEKLGFKVLP